MAGTLEHDRIKIGVNASRDLGPAAPAVEPMGTATHVAMLVERCRVRAFRRRGFGSEDSPGTQHPSEGYSSMSRASIAATTYSALSSWVDALMARVSQSSGLPTAGNDDRLVERSPVVLLADRIHRAKFPQQLVDQRAQARSWRAVRK